MSKLTYEYTWIEFLVTQRQKVFRKMYVGHVLVKLFQNLIKRRTLKE